MRKLIFTFSLLVFMSCVEERDEFIPVELGLPHSTLSSLLTPRSFAMTLSNTLSHSLFTDYNSMLEIPAGIVETQSSDKYEIRFIEMNSARDYMLHNMDNSTHLGNVHNIYSFFIDFNTFNEKKAKLNNSITIRIPSEKYSEKVILGEGILDASSLSWNYNNNMNSQNITYGSWQFTNGEGGISQENGYILEVNQPGWYNLAVELNEEKYFKKVCLSYADSELSSENTVSYIIANSNNYFTKFDLNDNSDNTYCIDNLPLAVSQQYTIFSLAQKNNQLYYALSFVESDTDRIIQSFSYISEDELISLVESL